ncbi:MAG TPA: magnesium transporter [Anaerolineae bacterium]|nr:magnesium transporter [Anaerolineae bacterium]
MNLYELTQTHLEARDMQGLKTLMAEADMDGLLLLIQDLTPQERVIVFRLLDKNRALTLFEQLDVEQAQALLAAFTDEQAIAIFAALDPDERARLLDELPAAVAKRLVAALPPQERAQVNLLLGYGPETAGRIMTPKYIRLTQEMTVAQALEKVRTQAVSPETLHTLYVTDAERCLVGWLPLQALILNSPATPIVEIMNPDVAWVTTDTDQEETAQRLHHRDLLSLAVVDQGQRLVGVITVDDAMEIMEEEVTEDIFDKAAVVAIGSHDSSSYRLVNGKLWDIWPMRLPFLLIALVGGLLAGAVIGVFEDTLHGIPMLAMFIPVVMDMGGNAGTQSTTIFARALALGHINMRHFGAHLLREIGVGVTMGAAVGVLAGLIGAIWQGMPALGWVIGLALTATLTLATTLGFLIPYLLTRIGLDPAAGADPIITTIKDITGLLIYFALAYYLLGPMFL